jgi:alpha-L-rhamnosidase
MFLPAGNTYHEVWTLKDGSSEFENHEYKLFRWAEINVTAAPSAGGAGSSSSSADDDVAGVELDLSAWVVNYPWSEAEEDLGMFNSSNDMLNKVWELCKNTVKVTSLDTTTDSNTREKLPYEADGYITGGTRHAMQRDSTWQRHSSKHNIRNPTWPTEWRQIMSLMAYEDYMATGTEKKRRKNGSPIFGDICKTNHFVLP